MNHPVTERKLRVAFQGERGAFSEEAAVRLLGEDIELVPRPTFEALYESISEDAADKILAPIENSLAGSIHRSYDLLLECNLTITGETVIPVVHNLIARPGAEFGDVQIVQSHPVALAQCERFFRAHPAIKRIATEDTAGSVRQMMEQSDKTRAAIAGRRAAEIYGAVVLRDHLEDHPENYTRFLLLAPLTESFVTRADKLSLVLKLAHRPGALHHALEPFANRGIDLLKIESRPVRGAPWQYHFYLDLQASMDDERAAEALRELRARADEVRVLGCYPSAKNQFASQH
ncbi:MAG: prephenate dehydratase [Pyrinomonadaceae bacterium]